MPGIQTSHPDYGKVDATSDTNEVMFEAFAAMFDGGECGNFDSVLGPTSHALLSAMPPRTRRAVCTA